MQIVIFSPYALLKLLEIHAKSGVNIWLSYKEWKNYLEQKDWKQEIAGLLKFVILLLYKSICPQDNIRISFCPTKQL